MSRTEDILGRIERLDYGSMHRSLSDADLGNEVLMTRLSRDADRFAEAREAVKRLASLVGGCGDQAILRAAFVAEVVGTHRHTQEGLLFAILAGMADLATLSEEDPGEWMDPRNALAYASLQAIVRRCERDIYLGRATP